MTKEQLLMPRYLCTGTPGKPLWWGCYWKHGDIIKLNQTAGGYACIYEDYKGLHFVKELHFADFPHLFSPLQWWEFRAPEDMPEYLMFRDNSVYQIILWSIISKNIWELVLADGRKYSYDMTVCVGTISPATREEYEAYLKQKEAQS